MPLIKKFSWSSAKSFLNERELINFSL